MSCRHIDQRYTTYKTGLRRPHCGTPERAIIHNISCHNMTEKVKNRFNNTKYTLAMTTFSLLNYFI